MIEGILFQPVDKWPLLLALLLSSIMIPMGFLAIAWKTWKGFVVMLVVSALLIAAIILWWPKTTKSYPAICQQIDGKVYCVLKEGRLK